MPQLAESEFRALVESIAAAAAAARPATTPAGDLARALEPTLLAPTATGDDVDRLCDWSAARGVAAVCVAPVWLARAAARLHATPVAAATVVGFPLGSSLATTKVQEAAECLKLGADELDVVINLGALRAGLDELVRDELRAVCALARAAGARVKAILELPALQAAEKRRAAELAIEAGCEFLKTATGFGPGGATVEDIALLHGLAAGRARVKAAGGIRSAAAARAMLAAGADRIGTSSPADVLAG